ncbi:helix-turn-helix transcriptional regulator [Halalkalibaculum sp. DA3122]|uniref:helix-turn-helix transcriptional regulator n=1 Tax=Halalkalibaculum sp. DA3122 TaxID=3373607 RepID=UPI003754EBA9
MPNSDLQLLRPKEVCQLLGGIHISTLYRWMDEGKFPVQKIQIGPRAVGFKRSEVEKYINGEMGEHTEESDSEVAAA